MRTIDERIASEEGRILAAVNAAKSSSRVAMPGIIQSFDRTQQTVTVKLAIREKVSVDGSTQDMEIPLLVDVPIVLPRAGGYALALIPQADDECLVIFGDVCIDAWWQSGDVQNMAELRRHDFSDGFAILGTWSQPRRIDNLPESGAVLMSEHGRGSVAVVGDEVRITGNLNLNGAELRPTVGLSILTTEDGNAILVTED